jgi:Domain of unknown function (DUF6983)
MEKIPLIQSQSTVFNVDLNSINYNMQTKYNYRFGYWTLDILIGEDPFLMGIGMLIGTNILSQYPKANNIGALIMFDTSDSNLDANFNELGERVIMIYLTPEELDEIVESAGTIAAAIL